MASVSISATEITNEMRHHLEHEVAHVGHLLSGQGPISTFVHHNTLHGLQHLPFEEAVAEAEAVIGGRGYLPIEEFRRHYRRGRITAGDVDHALRERFPDAASDVLAVVAGREITRHEVLTIALVHDIEPLDPARLAWAAEEGAFRRLRGDVPEEAKKRLLAAALRELGTGLDRIGVDWTVSEWAKETLGVDLPAAIRAEVRAQRQGAAASADRGGGRRMATLSREHQTADREVVRWLDKLDIPEERRAGYIRCIDNQGLVHPRLHALWLRAEARHLERIARQRFDSPGSTSALSRRLTRDVEGYAVETLFCACLDRLGLADPRASVGAPRPGDLDPPDGQAEALFAEFAEMERRGGPPVPVDSAQRERILALVDKSLGHARDSAPEAHAPGGGSEDADRRSAAPTAGPSRAVQVLCATIQSELEPSRIHRRGLDALTALVSLSERPEDEAPLLAALTSADPRRLMLESCSAELEERLSRLGSRDAHRDFLLALTGEDIHRTLHPYLIRICAAFLDEGLSALPMQGRELGFYDAWRSMAELDATFRLEDLPGCYDALRDLPAIPADAVIREISRLGVAEEHWQPYLRRLLLSLPGFSGMAHWRQTHPSYPAQKNQPIDLLQLLAVRLFYEGLLIRRLCRKTWNLDGTLDSLKHYFRRHTAEFFVRLALFDGGLPDDLALRARALVDGPVAVEGDDPWLPLAEIIWMYRARAGSGQGSAFRLFHLAQHLGLSAGQLQKLPRASVDQLLAAEAAFPSSAHRPVWQDAYESHYRDEVLGALTQKQRVAPERPRDARAKAQLVFCIDDREESIRRHIEELDPGYETLGAAGFFGVAMHYRGLADQDTTPLCPVNVTPSHEVAEVPRQGAEGAFRARSRRTQGGDAAREVYRAAQRNVVSSYFLIDLIGMFALIPLLGRLISPRRFAGLVRFARRLVLPEVTTELVLARPPDAPAPRAERLAIGFTLAEQADRVAGMLRNTGLVPGLAPLVVLLGHGSISENNPHLSAYDCGACGGKHGGPNARAYAAMANRPEVREALRARAIDIPDDTWFIGAEHNTADDAITYYDRDDIPSSHRAAFTRLAADLETASALSAHERCRRFASAPRDPSPGRALRHVVGRTTDFSQARPELGHVTNACAVVGRRDRTKGVFLDRRAFLVSYDPTKDEGGKFLEGILLAVAPVGAGINLEYYFSTIDNAIWGCGTKVPHNVCGLIGVMEGAQSDLRTGLPRQMIEIHEPVRLQMIVEAKTSTLAEIYGRQPPLQELVGNAWVHLIAMDPDTGEFSVFDRRRGFVPWRKAPPELPVVDASPAWYRGKTDFLSPALIIPPAGRRAAEVAHA